MANEEDREEESGEPFVKNARALSDADRIQELRERLYARDIGAARSVRHELPRPEVRNVAPPPVPVREAVPQEIIEEPMPRKKTWTFRRIAFYASSVFFVVALAVSAGIMMFGNNTISGENISLGASGPLVVSGGEEFQYQVTVANQNSVAIQSATLIVEYPRGTRSVGVDQKEITTERIPLLSVAAGELVTIPLSARIFGEENEEKSIKVSIDYRVTGSNATFKKSADPLSFRVSTAPVIITIDSVERIASGQRMSLKLSIQSNSPSAIDALVARMEYPDGFDVTSVKPDASYGKESWYIEGLKPSESRTITIEGVVSGTSADTKKFFASVGVPEASNRTNFTSSLSSATHEVEIEKPFLKLDVSVNGSTASDVVIDGYTATAVDVVFKNTLSSTIRNGKIQVMLNGNALNEFRVRSEKGFFDSNENTLTWDGADTPALAEMKAGAQSTVRFTLEPKQDVERSPEVSFDVSVSGDRMDTNNEGSEKLEGLMSRVIRIVSKPQIHATALYESGPFQNTGPTPPVAEKVTQYTYLLTARAGSSDLTDAVITATVPQYVSWLDFVSSDTATYNPSTRRLTWRIGDIPANTLKEVYVQVAMRPSLTQVGQVPILLGDQSLVATDSFTGTEVQAQSGPIYTSLIEEENKALHEGVVLRP